MIIFGSPSRYVQGPDALDELGGEFLRIASHAVLVVDPFVEAHYGARIRASAERAGLDLTLLPFGGESSPEEVARLAKAADSLAPQLIAAAGGGKCIDAGKALAAHYDAAVATIPTIASTDAPTSHNYVLYDGNHKMLAVEKLRRNPELVLVDTRIIAKAPRHLFVAGIGDAIGKVFEVEQCARQGGSNIFGGRSANTARVLARACHEVLRAHAVAALAAIDRGEPDATFEQVVEATVLMSGLAFESGGLSIAHSMTRGLTAVAPWKDTLHGYQVAYANLVQIVLEGRDPAYVRELAGFYRQVGLPVSLRELGNGAVAGTDALDTIARLTLTAPHMRHFPRALAAEEIRAAMEELERQDPLQGAAA